MNLELGNVLALVQAYGVPALIFVVVVVLGRELIKKGFSVHVAVGRARR